MLRSWPSAAKIVEIIRDLYDEYLREHRLESGLRLSRALLVYGKSSYQGFRIAIRS